MSTTFRPYLPEQSLLLPPDVREWLPEGHLAHHVSDLVDGLDLTAFYAPYEGDGRRNAPYDPRIMVKVLLYGYATGVFSSRRIARKLEEDVGFRVLAAGNFPLETRLPLSRSGPSEWWAAATGVPVDPIEQAVPRPAEAVADREKRRNRERPVHQAAVHRRGGASQQTRDVRQQETSGRASTSTEVTAGGFTVPVAAATRSR